MVLPRRAWEQAALALAHKEDNMEKKTNYGKIIAITLAVIAAASAIAYVIYRLARKFFGFCEECQEDELPADDALFEEIEEDDEDLLFPEEEELIETQDGEAE
jgi:hypothetical protein